MITSLFYKIDFTWLTFTADFQYLLLIFQAILLSFFVAVAPAGWAGMVKQSKAKKLYRTDDSTENFISGKAGREVSVYQNKKKQTLTNSFQIEKVIFKQWTFEL